MSSHETPEQRNERFNTHADPPLTTPGVPAEEDLSSAQAEEQAGQDPETVPNAPNDPELKERATVAEPGVQDEEGGGRHA